MLNCDSQPVIRNFSFTMLTETLTSDNQPAVDNCFFQNMDLGVKVNQSFFVIVDGDVGF